MSSPWRQLVNGLRTWCGVAAKDSDDRQLLERFASERDQAAFGQLLDRHGPMVWGVCLRVLGNGHEAEDAFQATFLVLLRHGGQGWRDSIAGWLYRVAQRTAARALWQRQRRRFHEAQTAPMTRDNAERDACLAVLDEEMARLPEKIRLPLVLCYLRGQSREQAARQLGCTAAAVKSRLERGRELLRKRLERRGLPVSAVALAALLTDDVRADVPPALTIQTRNALVGEQLPASVASLAQGVLQAMFWKKLTRVAFIVLAIGAAGSVFLFRSGLFGELAVATPLPVDERPAPSKVFVNVVSGGDQPVGNRPLLEPWILPELQKLGSPWATSQQGWQPVGDKNSELVHSERGGRVVTGRVVEQRQNGTALVEVSGTKIAFASRQFELKPGGTVVKLTDYPGAGNMFLAFWVGQDPAQAGARVQRGLDNLAAGRGNASAFSISYNDLHPLHGGLNLKIHGSGKVEQQAVRAKVKDTRDVSAADLARLAKLLLEKKAYERREPERFGVPDESRVTLIVRYGDDSIDSWEWHGDLKKNDRILPIIELMTEIAWK